MTKYKGMKKLYFNKTETLSSFEKLEDGSLLVHGVVAMAAGTWTDMHGITTIFSEDVLQRCAGKWDDNAVWTRHAGGAPRSVTEKVGAVINPTYSPSVSAVVADILLHNQTDASRSCSALVQMAREAGGIKDVSAETMVEMTPDGEVLDMVFTGLALVEDGACETCRIPAYGKEDIAMADEEIEKKTTEEVEKTEEETEDKPEETPKSNDDLIEVLEALVEAIIPDTKELIEAIKESEGEDRIRALGQLEGCAKSWGFSIEAYSKAVDEKLAEFSKTLDEKLEGITTQYSKPAGLKGHAGADKEVAEERQTVTFYGRGRTALY